MHSLFGTMEEKSVLQDTLQKVDESVTSNNIENVKREKDDSKILNHHTVNKLNEDTNFNESSDEPKIAKAFPWFTDFIKICRTEIGVTNIITLENLMTVYLKHVGSSIVECYVKPNRAAKLKRCMNDTLVLFHMLYSDIKKPLEHSSYLDKMSDLLAFYIDMEIKASRRGKESIPKIASKLTSSLYLFLDHSIDHILDAILKTKNMTKNFYELCSFIFRRVLKDGPGRAIYEMTYVRYILVFKMWKRVVKGVEERRKVMKLASIMLIPPSQFREKLKSGLLCGVLPKIPKSRPDITMFLMQAKFCVKDKSKEFLKVVADPKQQCVLGASLSTDLDRPLFFGEESPHNSNSDDQEETSGSSMLMNDIWSSMSLETGLRDHLRLSTVTKPKKNSKIKLKKKAKVNISKEGDKAKKKSNKKKPKKVINNAEVENKSCKETKENVIPVTKPAVTQSTNEVIESCTQTLEEPSTAPSSKESFEFTPLIPVENIKVEADSSDDVCFVGIIRKSDDDLVTSNNVTDEVRREKDAEMLDVAREVEIRSDSDSSSLKVERPGTTHPAQLPSSHPHDIFLYDQQSPTPQEWSPAPTQSYFNNTVCDFINGYLPEFDIESANTEIEHRDIYDMLDMGKTMQGRHKEMYTVNNDNVLGQIPCDDGIRNKNVEQTNLSTNENNVVRISPAAGGNVTLVSENQQHPLPSQHEERQEKMNELIESIKEQNNRSSEKNTHVNVISNDPTPVASEVEKKKKEKDHLLSVVADDQDDRINTTVNKNLNKKRPSTTQQVASRRSRRNLKRKPWEDTNNILDYKPCPNQTKRKPSTASSASPTSNTISNWDDLSETGKWMEELRPFTRSSVGNKLLSQECKSRKQLNVPEMSSVAAAIFLHVIPRQQ